MAHCFGPQQLYQDQLWMRAFGERSGVYKPPIDTKTIEPLIDDKDNGSPQVVLNFITSHQKWGQGKRIAALCDSFNLPVSPHVGGGGILSVAATVHYSLAIPNFQIMEHSHDAHAKKGVIAHSYPIPEEGRFAAPQQPGLGVDIDEAAVVRYAS